MQVEGSFGHEQTIYPNPIIVGIDSTGIEFGTSVALDGDTRHAGELSRLISPLPDEAERVFPGWKDHFEEWKKVSHGRLCDYSGMTYEMIEKHGGVQWPLTEEEVSSGTERGSYPGMVTRLYQDGKFQTESGKAKFWTINNNPPPEVPSKEYPFWLNTGRTVEHWHTGTKTRGIKLLNRLSPEAWVEVNPRDARKLKFMAGDYVKVVSRRGSIERVILRVTETVAPGQIFIPFHFAEANANNLTVNDACPISREPNYKQAAVRIEKSDAPLLGRKK